MARCLYLCSYDIRKAKRLRKGLRILKDYAGGGQYSVFECYLTDTEKAQLLKRMQRALENEDSFMILPLKRERAMYTLGTAVAPLDGDFYYLG